MSTTSNVIADRIGLLIANHNGRDYVSQADQALGDYIAANLPAPGRANAIRAIRIQCGEHSVSPEEVVDLVIAALGIGGAS